MEIVRLRGGDGGRLRDVRLRALADAPHAFSSSLAREVGLSPEFWEKRVVESELGEDGAVFIAIEDDHSVGMAGGFFIDEGSRVVVLSATPSAWQAASSKCSVALHGHQATTRAEAPGTFSRGTAETRLRVYSSRGLCKTSSAWPSSTTLPSCITSTRSLTWCTTPRSWEMNR